MNTKIKKQNKRMENSDKKRARRGLKDYEVYEGEWKDDNRTGKGNVTHADGAVLQQLEEENTEDTAKAARVAFIEYAFRQNEEELKRYAMKREERRKEILREELRESSKYYEKMQS